MTFFRLAGLTTAAALASSAAWAGCDIPGGDVRVLGNDYGSIQTLVAGAEACAGDGVTVSANLTTEHQSLQVAALTADPAQYMLLLAADGTLSAQSDCNRARGSYELDGEAISIGPLTSTAALCPPESLSEAYVKGLTTAATYAIADGELSIHFGPDEGVMHFMMAP